MFGDVEGRRGVLAYIAAIGGRATALDLVSVARIDDEMALAQGLGALVEEGLLVTPFGAMESPCDARADWLKRYRPGQAEAQVYELTVAGKTAARAGYARPLRL